MDTQPILIAGGWQQSQSAQTPFHSVNPATGERLDAHYPVSDWAEIERALAAAGEAVTELQQTPVARIADFLEAFAANIERDADALVSMANLETALPVEPRLRMIELPRTTGQLRQAAAAVRERSWRRATIDTGPNIRSMFAPLAGPVVIFGPNNFPLAFNAISGGDFAAAIAAGNPVIAKAHPGHPGTTRLLAKAAIDAIRSSGVPLAMVQMIYHMSPADGLRLVAHPQVGASAFTGSRVAGMALKQAADAAGKPIYLEMSSLNPLFLLPGALQQRGEAIAAELFNSCTAGVGQFCTKPGLTILVDNDAGREFVAAAQKHFQGSSAGVLLGERGPAGIQSGLEILQAHGAELLAGGHPASGPGFRFENTLLVVSGDQFLAQPQALQTEVFGPVSLLVLARDVEQMLEITAQTEGNLTASLYSDTDGADDKFYDILAARLRPTIGRLLNDKMPTGVAVVPAMVHGGPYPATGHPGFTAVGIPASLLRFAALHCYDNVRAQRLPPELQDRNPTGAMWRLIDGEWTQSDVTP